MQRNGSQLSCLEFGMNINLSECSVMSCLEFGIWDEFQLECQCSAMSCLGFGMNCNLSVWFVMVDTLN
jgi:hypothetical protein